MKESHHRAMVAGKQRVASEIVWAIEVGRLQFRCRPTDAPLWIVEIKSAAGWEEVHRGDNPFRLFALIADSKLVTDELTRKVSETNP